MAKKNKTVYHVSYHGPSGKQEQVTVEATNIVMIDGIEDTLVCFNSRLGTVFALPFRNLITSRLEVMPNSPPKLVSLLGVK